MYKIKMIRRTPNHFMELRLHVKYVPDGITFRVTGVVSSKGNIPNLKGLLFTQRRYNPVKILLPMLEE